MPITVSCSSCDREMKVKDELAGRKIKCPDCGEAISVREKSARKSTKPPVDEEDEPEQEQPKKKKKKKAAAKSNKVLLIAVLAGGGVFLVIVIVAVVLIVMFAGGGRNNDVAGTNKIGQNTNLGPGGDNQDGPEGAGRIVDLKELKWKLVQFGLAYDSYVRIHHEGPSSHLELKKYYNDDPSVDEYITSKKITVIWGISEKEFLGNPFSIIAYETNADRKGYRMVVKASAVHFILSEAEFQKAPRAKGK